MTRTDWIEPGAEVVIIHGRHQQPSPVFTIERVLKRDVVLSNGDRFSLARLAPNGEHIVKHSPNVWDPSSALFPADHERVERARREQSERAGQDRIRSLAYAINDHARAGRWADVDRAVSALAPIVRAWVESHGGEP